MEKNKKLRVLLFIFAVCLTFNLPFQAKAEAEAEAEAEEYPTRANNPIGIGIYLGGPEGILSGALDYYFTPNINADLGFVQWSIGDWTLILAHLGPKYYFTGDSKTSGWSPYVGVMPRLLKADMETTYIVGFTTETVSLNFTAFGLCIPFGMEYIGTSGITFAIEAEYNILMGAKATVETSDGVKHEEEFSGAGAGFWGGIKIGWHF